MKINTENPAQYENFAWLFGTVRLVKLGSGRHELTGGSEEDRRAAREWISFVAPEIVLSDLNTDGCCPEKVVESRL